MIQTTRSANGFTAVELLIALTIAATLLIAGHQLYAVIVRDSGEIRQRARASDLAQDYLRRYAASAPTVCAPATPFNAAINPSPEGLSDVWVNIRYECPQSSTPNLTRVYVKVRYGENKEVAHAIYRIPS